MTTEVPLGGGGGGIAGDSLPTLSSLPSMVGKLYLQIKTQAYKSLHPITIGYETCFQNFVDQYNLSFLEQFVVLAVTIYIVVKVISLAHQFVTFLFSEKQRSLKQYMFYLLVTYIPFARNKLEAELKTVEAQFDEYIAVNTEKRCPRLPTHGMKPASIKKRVAEWVVRDELISGNGKVSGARYCDDVSYEDSVKDFAKDFLFHNPLHYQMFPAARQMEAEIIRMTTGMFGSDDGFGFTTTGGTESILMGVLAHRNYFRKFHNITKPNIVMSISAHAAFIKACKFFNIEFRRAKALDNGEVDINDLKKRIDKNTILLVGSVPNYPNGAVDDIPSLAKLAKKHKIGLHVDCCLGGFVVAFAKDCGIKLPAFDFKLDGVSSISCDHHKYALAPKGISVIMFKDNIMRQQTYTSVSDWPGGFYATPSVSGSKAGAPIAGAWYAMMVHGREGYVEHAKHIMNCINELVKAIREIPELAEIDTIGTPIVCSLALVYKKEAKKNIYHLEGALATRGWKFSGIQLPPAIHISLNHGIANRTKELIKDLKASVKEVAEYPDRFVNSSSASMYGASIKVPDIKTLDRVLDCVIDSFLKL